MTGFPHPPPDALEGLRHLVAADPDLAGIIPAAGPLPWRVRPAGFPGLLQAIVGQQISNAAAAAIWRRLQAVPGALDPVQLLTFDASILQSAGLSRPKVAHAFSLAEAFAAGHLAADALALMEDEAAIATICTVRGMGRWSAEIYLLFALGRPDVFPGGDLALAAAAAALKELDTRPKPKALVLLADGWRPWRGLAARLLWHHWRFLTGRPAMDDLPLQ